jgi:formylmethanofuran dehydrogenase subunit C
MEHLPDDPVVFHAALPLPYGVTNTKQLLIHGNVGWQTGHGMTSGLLVIKGNVDTKDLSQDNISGAQFGCSLRGGEIRLYGNCNYGGTGSVMQGGLISVFGNVGDRVGQHMRGGTIYIEGNAGKEVGHSMEGGEIYIEGTIESLARTDGHWSNPTGGTIYHQGKKVVENGKLVWKLAK